MAIELNKKGNIKWSVGDWFFNIFISALLGWSDLFGGKPEEGGSNG